MMFEPGEHGRNFHRILARFLLLQVEDVGTGERRKARVEPLRRFGPHKEQGGIIIQMA
jgi:hypothetical protein